jgi:hypothetical protein
VLGAAFALVIVAAVSLLVGLVSERGTASMLVAAVAGAGALLLIAIVVARSGIRSSGGRS